MTEHATETDKRLAEALRQQLERDPFNHEALTHLGALMFEPFHKPNESIALLQRAIGIDTRSVNARFWLAKCLFHYKGAAEAARVVLSEALSIDPLRPDCLTLMAAVLQDLDRGPANYVELLRNAVRQAPEWPSARHQLAQALLELGELDEARATLREAPSLNTLVHPFADSLVEYTEEATTGRGRPGAKRDLQRLLGEIERRLERERRP